MRLMVDFFYLGARPGEAVEGDIFGARDVEDLLAGLWMPENFDERRRQILKPIETHYF